MFVLSNFLLGIAEVLRLALQVYLWLIIARAVLSWVTPDPYNPIVRFLHRATDPVLHWVRRRLPLAFGGIDFSPILVILFLPASTFREPAAMVRLTQGLVVSMLFFGALVRSRRILNYSTFWIATNVLLIKGPPST